MTGAFRKTFLHGHDLKLHKYISRKYKPTHFLLSQTSYMSGVTLMTFHMRRGKMQGVWMERDNCSLNIFKLKITQIPLWIPTRGSYAPEEPWIWSFDSFTLSVLHSEMVSVMEMLLAYTLSLWLWTVYLRFSHPLMLNSEWKVLKQASVQ